MLLTALLAVSCRTSKTTVTTQTNSVSTATTDSTDSWRVDRMEKIQVQFDSLYQASLRQQIEKWGETHCEQTLHLLFFDTLQPADSVTGLPPVKAALTATKTADSKATEKRGTTAAVKDQVKKESNDSTELHADHTSAYTAADSTAAQTHTSYATKKQGSGWGNPLLLLLLLVGWLALIITLYIKLKK